MKSALIAVAATIATAEPLRSVIIEEPLAEGVDDTVIIQFPEQGSAVYPYEATEELPYYLARQPTWLGKPAFEPRSIILEDGTQFIPELGLPEYELPIVQRGANAFVRPDMARASNWGERLPYRFYLAPLPIDEPYYYAPPMTTEGRRQIPAYPPAWPSLYPSVLTEPVEQFSYPLSREVRRGAAPLEVFDGSYVARLEQPLEQAAAATSDRVKDIETAANAAASGSDIAEAAAAIGMRPRRVWDRETVIDLLGEADAEEESEGTTNSE